MAIKVKEQHRLGSSVNVGVIDGVIEVPAVMGVDKAGKSVIITPPTKRDHIIYDRYVPAREWDADPKAVCAKICQYLNARPVEPKPTPALKKELVVMTDAEVNAKLVELAENDGR